MRVKYLKSDFCVPRNRIKTCGVFGCPFLTQHITFHYVLIMIFYNIEINEFTLLNNYNKLMKKHFQQRMSWLPCR